VTDPKILQRIWRPGFVPAVTSEIFTNLALKKMQIPLFFSFGVSHLLDIYFKTQHLLQT
jgi:hypothetical protein